VSALRIFVVEDEGLIALMIEDMLEDLGCEVAGSVSSVSQALGWLAEGGEFDGALLDVNLGGEHVFPIAEALAARGSPFAFTTGYGEIPDPRFAAAPILGKPIRREALEDVLRAFGLGG